MKNYICFGWLTSCLLIACVGNDPSPSSNDDVPIGNSIPSRASPVGDAGTTNPREPEDSDTGTPDVVSNHPDAAPEASTILYADNCDIYGPCTGNKWAIECPANGLPPQASGCEAPSPNGTTKDYCCEPTCVRFAPNDHSWCDPGTSFYFCPGVVTTAPLPSPACAQVTQTSNATGYCCP